MESMKMPQTKTMILVAGPESSGTRIFTESLSQHPLVSGSPTASDHFDLMDDVWTAVRNGDRSAAVTLLQQAQLNPTVITRRSLPHGPAVGQPAPYMKFPNFDLFHEIVSECGYRLVVMVATRSPLATAVSSRLQRDSVGGDIQKSFNQYQASLQHVTGFCLSHSVPFFILSLEAAVLDGAAYFNSLFRMLGLPLSTEFRFEGKPNVNGRRYQWADDNLADELRTEKISAVEMRPTTDRRVPPKPPVVGRIWRKLAG